VPFNLNQIELQSLSSGLNFWGSMLKLWAIFLGFRVKAQGLIFGVQSLRSGLNFFGAELRL